MSFINDVLDTASDILGVDIREKVKEKIEDGYDYLTGVERVYTITKIDPNSKKILIKCDTFKKSDGSLYSIIKK